MAGMGGCPRFLSLFSKRKAFIYFLDILGQILSLVLLSSFLPSVWLSFIDNTAGLSATRKGFGSDMAVNNLLACFGAIAAQKQWPGHWGWVRSGVNIADPVSCGDFTYPLQFHGLRLRAIPEDFWNVLARVAQDTEYAMQEAPDVLISFSWDFENGRWVMAAGWWKQIQPPHTPVRHFHGCSRLGVRGHWHLDSHADAVKVSVASQDLMFEHVLSEFQKILALLSSWTFNFGRPYMW